MKIDLRDSEKLKELPNDVDLVIHLAANARVYDLVVDTSLARDNFITTYNVLEYVKQNKISRVMFASSREVYGNTGKEILNEEDSFVKNCESPYTASKIAGEALVYAYHECYDIDFVIFRFSNAYGMYDESDRVIPLFIRKCEKNESLTIFGKDKLLDFTFVDDVIKGIILTIEKFEEVKNEVYNLAYGEGTTIIKVAELIKQNMRSNSETIIKENRTGEVVKYVADIEKARKNLGYSPTIGIEEGIKKSIEWYEKSLKK